MEMESGMSGWEEPKGASPESVRYAVISTIRDEEDYITQTAGSLASQGILPGAWVVVDDGSTDATPRILAELAERFEWLHVVTLDEVGGTNRCGRIMHAFFTGYAALEGEFDFVIKMDGDITFEPDHIECLLARFAEDPSLGIASGTFTEPAGNGWRTRTNQEGHAIGALRSYRSECLRGVIDRVAPELVWSPDAGKATPVVLSWDSIDHLYSEEMGWRTRGFQDLVILHHRTEGGRSHVLKGWFEQGVVSYVMGYHPVFAVGRGLVRIFQYPYFVGAFALTAGYMVSAARRDVHRADDETVQLVRAKQVRRIRRMVGLRDRSAEGGS